MKLIRTSIAALLLLTVSACAQKLEPATATLVPFPSVTPAPTEGPKTCEAQSGGTDSGQMLLNDLRVLSVGGHDRIVFTFEPANGEDPHVPAWTVEAVDPPLLSDGSGEELKVAGKTFLAIKFIASGVDLSALEFRKVYNGEDRFSPANPNFVVEMVKGGDYENHLTWYAGMSSASCFSVSESTGPIRVAVDVGSDVKQATPTPSQAN